MTIVRRNHEALPCFARASKQQLRHNFYIDAELRERTHTIFMENLEHFSPNDHGQVIVLAPSFEPFEVRNQFTLPAEDGTSERCLGNVILRTIPYHMMNDN